MGLWLGLLFGVNGLRAADTIWLDSLDLSTMHQGWGKPQVNRGVREKPLSLGGKAFPRGSLPHNQGFRVRPLCKEGRTAQRKKMP